MKRQVAARVLRAASGPRPSACAAIIIGVAT